jgi:hypothetical protein
MSLVQVGADFPFSGRRRAAATRPRASTTACAACGPMSTGVGWLSLVRRTGALTRPGPSNSACPRTRRLDRHLSRARFRGANGSRRSFATALATRASISAAPAVETPESAAPVPIWQPHRRLAGRNEGSALAGPGGSSPRDGRLRSRPAVTAAPSGATESAANSPEQQYAPSGKGRCYFEALAHRDSARVPPLGSSRD